MKLAIAQINGRLGDIEGICIRLRALAQRAAEEGSTLLCVPATLLSGPFPGGLLTYRAFQSTVLAELTSLAESILALGVVILIPVALPFGDSSYFEVLMLKEGRVVPSRLVCFRKRGMDAPGAWAPPVFDHDGVRIALTFDASRDLDMLPQGCDLLIHFQVASFDAGNGETWGAPGLDGSTLREPVAERRICLASVCPVGGFDETVYVGGSFVLNETGGLAASAPSFEEQLLLVDIDRSHSLDAGNGLASNSVSRQEMLWSALELHLRDHMAAMAQTSVVLELRGDLPSSLLAALAVDALGSRRVLGVLCCSDQAVTPQQHESEVARVRRVREIASRLGIRLVEESPSFERCLSHSLEPGRFAVDWDHFYRAILLQRVAISEGALPLCSLTKTEYALCGDKQYGVVPGALSPFGDVYLTDLEFLGRYRNGVSYVIDSDVVTLGEVERLMADILGRLVWSCCDDADSASRAALCLQGLSPSQVDGLLRAHIEGNHCLGEISLAKQNGQAAAFILMAVSRGELARRGLPAYPMVSSMTFEERRWPYQLSWSDVADDVEGYMDAETLAREEIGRIVGAQEGAGERARGEIMSMIGEMLGLSPQQREDLISPEGMERMQRELEQIGSAMDDRSMGSFSSDAHGADRGNPGASGQGPTVIPLFSLN